MDLNSVTGLPDKDTNNLFSRLKSVKGDNGEIRHAKWIAVIERGTFSFGTASPVYIAKGKGSWKRNSIGQVAAADSGREIFPYRKTFLKSNWKKFHNAYKRTALMLYMTCSQNTVFVLHNYNFRLDAVRRCHLIRC